jgi:protein-disulfide isomerase
MPKVISKKPSILSWSFGNATPIILIGLLIVAAFLIGSLSAENKLLKGGSTAGIQSETGNSAPIAAPQTNNNQGETAIVGVSVDDDPTLGDKNAPITLIEFSDYECPFCKSYFDQTLPRIKQKYVDTGKVKIVYRDLPLPFHDPMATKEAIAANCARDQRGDEGYFQYHDEIFTRTKSNGNGLSDSDLEKISQDLGLDLSQFKACIEDERQSEEVKKDLSDARSVNASGTPTFFIGKSTENGVIQGERLVGAQPFSAFETVIEKYLK